MKEFFETTPLELPDNPFRLIGKEWMLLTAGSMDEFNTMTISWGGMGELWFKPVCFCFVRPTRYTYEFMEKADVFTLSFFAEEHRQKLNYCGSHSGRNVDKVKETGLTPRAATNGSVFFDEARMVMECRKIYFQDMDPKFFLDESLADNYPNMDYHRFYIGEITKVLKA